MIRVQPYMASLYTIYIFIDTVWRIRYTAIACTCSPAQLPVSAALETTHRCRQLTVTDTRETYRHTGTTPPFACRLHPGVRQHLPPAGAGGEVTGVLGVCGGEGQGHDGHVPVDDPAIPTPRHQAQACCSSNGAQRQWQWQWRQAAPKGFNGCPH